MKRALVLLGLAFLLHSCGQEAGKARIIIPSKAFDGSFNHGVIVYAVNINNPALTRRIFINDISTDLEIELASGPYVFQAIALDEDSGLKFYCAERLPEIHIYDGSLVEVDLHFTQDNCVDIPVFLNRNSGRFDSTSPVPDHNAIFQPDYCASAGDYNNTPTPSSECPTTPGVSFLVRYLADNGPGIQYCINDNGTLASASYFPIIMGNATIAPAGQVFTATTTVFSSPDCPQASIMFNHYFPKGFDSLPGAGNNAKLIITGGGSTADLFLGFF